MSGFFDALPAAPRVRPQLPVGCLFDIPTGKYYIGKHGESLLNCGLGAVNSIQGPPNGFKTELTNYLIFTALGRYGSAKGVIYDTENTSNYERMYRFTDMYPSLSEVDIFDVEEGRVRVTQSADLLGDVFFEEIKNIGEERKKQQKKLEMTTPFLNDQGEYIKIIAPVCVVIDSITEFKSTSVQENIVNKNSVGESGGNTQYLRDGLAKTQMMTQLPNLCNRSSLYFMQVAHVGQDIVMDQYAPKAPGLTYGARGRKSKGTPPKFSYINNNLFEIVSAGFAAHSSKDKSARYPRCEADRNEENKDLMIIEVVNLRNKNGPSGVTFSIFASQAEGVLPQLSMFDFIKEEEYGVTISPNKQNFTCTLYPGKSYTRFDIRDNLDNDYKLSRAVEITSQMCQMGMLWRSSDNVHLCTPEELYEAIKKQGYDWDILLGESRSYWLFVGDSDGKHYLSTMDLLLAAKGLYRPYWYDEVVKNKSKETKSK